MIGIVVGFDAGIELRSVDSVVCDWYSDDQANVYFDCLSAYTVANVGNDDKDFIPFELNVFLSAEICRKTNCLKFQFEILRFWFF